jgi:hypothetical protein
MPAVLLITGALLSAAAPAASSLSPDDGRPRVAVLALSHDASVSAELATRVSDDLRRRLLQQTRFQMVSGDELTTLLSQDTSGTARSSCDSDACLERVAAHTRADLVVFGRVGTEGDTPVLEGFVYQRAGGRVLPAGRVTGMRALAQEGSRELSEQLFVTASSASGAGPATWMTSPWMGLGVTLTAAGALAAVVGAGTAAFATWVFLNGYLDTGVRNAGRAVAIAAAVSVPVAALVALGGAGVMTGTVLLVE